MHNPKTHKYFHNELSVRGHNQILESNPTLSKHKGSTVNPLNMSVGNWKNKGLKTNELNKQNGKQDSISPPEPEEKAEKVESPTTVPNGEIDYRGMTLQQYFRTKSSQQCKTQQAGHKYNGDDNCQEANEDERYLFGSLEIKQTDEDQYNDSQQSVQTPGFPLQQEKPAENNVRQQRILDKYTKGHSKLKTEVEDEYDADTIVYINQNRGRLPSLSDSQTKTMRFQEQLENKKKKALSNPHADKNSMRFTFNDFYKYQKDGKNERLMNKVKMQRERAAQMRINELCLVTRYAQRFNINDAICRQIIKENKY